MKEEVFYDLSDSMESAKPQTRFWYPTVEEIKIHTGERPRKLEKYAALILFFAADPYKGTDKAKEREYKETVNFCRELSTMIPVEEDNH